MGCGVMFIDCPEYLEESGELRCGLPAEIENRYCLHSTDGPLDSARIRCPRGHWFNGPLDSLILDDGIRTLCAGMDFIPGRRASGS